MGMPVVTVAAGGMPVVEAANNFGTPVTEAANGFGVPVTKVVGKAGLPVVFETIGAGPPPTPPVFVNNGAQASVSGAALTLTLPGSRVNGNLLIAFIAVTSPSSAGLTWPGGWTQIDTNGGGGQPCAAYAYRYVDGSETSPNVTWTAVATARGIVMQFSGVKSSSPIGHTTENFFSGTTTITCAQIVPVSDKSLAFGMQSSGNSNTPAGWTMRFDTAVSGVRTQGWGKDLAAAGVGSGAISMATSAVGNVHIFLCEIKRAGAA